LEIYIGKNTLKVTFHGYFPQKQPDPL
jgi:hypothetical protein